MPPENLLAAPYLILFNLKARKMKKIQGNANGSHMIESKTSKVIIIGRKSRD